MFYVLFQVYICSLTFTWQKSKIRLIKDFWLPWHCVVSVMVVRFCLLPFRYKSGALCLMFCELLWIITHHHFRWPMLGVFTAKQTCVFFISVWNKWVVSYESTSILLWFMVEKLFFSVLSGQCRLNVNALMGTFLDEFSKPSIH